MSQPAVFLIVRDGKAKIYFNKWSSEGCLFALSYGPKGAEDMASIDEVELAELPWGEAGYLIDFDDKKVVFCGCLLDTLHALGKQVAVEESRSTEAVQLFLELISPKWPGWEFQYESDESKLLQAMANHKAFPS